MLKRLYIDNYLCLSNFEWQPGPRVLLAGRNGSGKSAVFNVLWSLKQLHAQQATTDAVFTPRTLTAWDLRDQQTFELMIEDREVLYEYRLVVEHSTDRKKCRIFFEQLRANDTLL